ncbi:MAG TPA: host attachment protein [Luteolibacter sp.]|nr:host attachment protein [Luteolibacter sp.]
MKKLIIAANLGNLRILRHLPAGEDPIEQEHLAEEPGESGKEHVKSIQETVTDQSGRFARGSAQGFETGMSHGEEHNLKSEIERAALKKIVARIECALSSEVNPPWVLAAPKPILPRMKRALNPAARDSLLSTVGADLTRTPLHDLEKRFLQSPS